MIGILSVVWFAMTREVNLVTEDYYKVELAYEEQIERLKNTQGLLEKPTFKISKDRKFVELNFPEALVPDKGQLTLYRPSDFTQDRKYKLELDGRNKQIYMTSGLIPGFWKAKLLWEIGENSYFLEFAIII